MCVTFFLMDHLAWIFSTSFENLQQQACVVSHGMTPIWRISTSAIFLNMLKTFPDITSAPRWPKTAGDCKGRPARCHGLYQDAYRRLPRISTIFALIANDCAPDCKWLCTSGNSPKFWVTFCENFSLIWALVIMQLLEQTKHQNWPPGGFCYCDRYLKGRLAVGMNIRVIFVKISGS